MIELTCINCGKKFEVNDFRKDAKFCCSKCYGEWRTKNKPVHKRICKECGKEFIIPTPSSKMVYCSKHCANLAKTTRICKKCEQCGVEFYVIKSRAENSKYCCTECANKAHKKEPNIYCDVCGKPIRRKLSHVLRNKHGNFCSKYCANKWKEIAYKGEGNHQYGLKGKLNSSFKGTIIRKTNNELIDYRIWCPKHPFAKSGRVILHRYLVEQNFHKFDPKYFMKIDNKQYLLPGVHVHHLNGNHDDNNIENLVPCTEDEHFLYHCLMKVESNKIKEILKNIAAVFKRGELLENPAEDNQQLNLDSNIFGSSTTNIRVLTSNVEDSNDNTSALPVINDNSEDIV